MFIYQLKNSKTVNHTALVFGRQIGIIRLFGGSFLNLDTICFFKKNRWGWDLNPPANAGDTGSIPGPGRSRGYGATKLVTTTMEPELWGPRAATTEAPEPPGPPSSTIGGAPAARSPVHLEWREPACNNEDPAQSKISTSILFL